MSIVQDKLWLDRVVDSVLESHPEGEILVSSGVSPSGSYHVGHLREVLTADAITWGIRQRGREAKHIHVVDDFDGLRKVPVNVPDDFSQYLGMPVYLVPAPDGSKRSYGQYFFDEFMDTVELLTDDIEVVMSHQKYQEGVFEKIVFDVLDRVDEVRDVVEQSSGRQLSRDWVPIQILDKNDHLNEAVYVSHDRKSGEVTYQDADGKTHQASVADGRVKLDWRIDWPARWHVYGVNVEPFGRDHATKGGSYDTGKALMDKIFGTPAPLPVPYEFINLAGETKKMSASKGTGITPAQALEVMPPALLRYFVLGSRPGVTLKFDIGLGFGRLFDNFAEMERGHFEGQDSQLYNLVTLGSDKRLLSDVPFNHLVTAYQSSLGDEARTLDVINRSEHSELVSKQPELIAGLLPYMDKWLDNWAPESVKYTVQDAYPEVELSEPQVKLLNQIADKTEEKLKTEDVASAQWFHETIHELREGFELEPKQAFEAIYKVILGQGHGPKAGWFLSTLEIDWLIARFRQAK